MSLEKVARMLSGLEKLPGISFFTQRCLGSR